MYIKSLQKILHYLGLTMLPQSLAGDITLKVQSSCGVKLRWQGCRVPVTSSWRRSYFEGWYWIKRRASSLSNTPWINSPSATRSGGGKGKDMHDLLKVIWQKEKKWKTTSSVCTKTISFRVSVVYRIKSIREFSISKSALIWLVSHQFHPCQRSSKAYPPSSLLCFHPQAVEPPHP